MTLLGRSRRFTVVALLGVAGTCAVPVAGLAANTCPIRLLPEDAAAPWRDAVAVAAARLAGLEAQHDCREVEVIVGPSGGATLAFVTTDGRGAARALETAADLAPALDALLITRPPPPPLPPSPAPARLPISAPVVTTPPGAPRPELHVLLGASAGGRFVWLPVAQMSPAVSLHASITIDRWELGVVAEYAPMYRPLAEPAPSGFASSSFATGLAVGRREPVGAAAIGYGLALSVQSTSESASEIPGLSTARALDFALPRIGLYGKVAYPQRSRVRFTSDLGLDAALGNLRDKSTDQRQIPRLPRFGMGLAVGVEVAVL